MKKPRFTHSCTVLVSLAFLLAVLAGCGGQKDPSPQSSDAPQTVTPTPQAAASVPPAEGSGEDGTLRVGSVAELLEAIRPDAEIILQPGRYDLMDFLADFPNTGDRDAWNSQHEYIQIQDVYDGLELVVRNVTGLYIKGGSEDPGDTEIVTQPRYATVLGFYDCCNIELACLTMGHTDGGECSGNVLDFYNCQNVRLRSMDLYGCGVVGICTMDGCKDFEVSNSTIRDCSDGPFDIYNASGAFTFTACTLADSEGGGWYSSEEEASLSFVGCFFGQEESNRWYWCWDMGLDDHITFEDCEWTEVTEYPDFDPEYEDYYGEYDEYVPDFDPDAMVEMNFDRAVKLMLRNSAWAGYSVVDPQSGDTYYFSEGTYESVYGDTVFLFFDSDGSAWLTYRNENLGLEWDVIDENLVCLENAEHSFYASLYQNSDDDYCWLLMQYDDELIWFY